MGHSQVFLYSVISSDLVSCGHTRFSSGLVNEGLGLGGSVGLASLVGGDPDGFYCSIIFP